ncbi:MULTISPECIES: hypothetical protein [Burkholderiaceae]|uniref:hypothetical protein n=1 Tax=Burkholderiaceae TaxID=119060 RepID=UPI0014211AD0|nr:MULTISPECIES: hypothetical protein [Burkholderiaceae]NIF51363.1 hypothetical protein [Burkholderia sp. Ax-1724]NIF77250.1 hypothetical protein [Paraburkholderia sp. Cy-641]
MTRIDKLSREADAWKRERKAALPADPADRAGSKPMHCPAFPGLTRFETARIPAQRIQPETVSFSKKYADTMRPPITSDYSEFGTEWSIRGTDASMLIQIEW